MPRPMYRPMCRPMSLGLGPLPVAMAVAAGIAVAPLFDRLGVDPRLHWLVVAAIVLALRRGTRIPRRAVVLALGFALGAARGAHPVVVAPAGVVADDRIVDRVTGVVRGPIVHGPRGD